MFFNENKHENQDEDALKEIFDNYLRHMNEL